MASLTTRLAGLPFTERSVAVSGQRGFSEQAPLRVLFSFDEAHRAYGETLAAVAVTVRPHVEVLRCELDELCEEITSFDPHVVVSSQPNRADPGGRPAWIQMSVETEEPSELCLAGDCSEETNPGLSRVLAVVDEVDSLLATGHRPDGC